MKETPILKANLEVFSETLIGLAEKNRNIVAVTSDSRGSGKLLPFADKFPDQIVEVGIAEQNLVGVAAGLASTGKKVFAVSPGSFLTSRALEQIKNDVAYSNQPVVLVGISSGVSYGALGSTHHSLHDIAALRAIHNITIVVPADAFETRHAIMQASTSDRPVFIRFGKKPMPVLPRTDESFQIGKASIICEGGEVNFIATGETVYPAYEASLLLQKQGISAGVISMHTIRPLDEKTLCRTAEKSKAIITVEEHSIHGGLGEACSAILIQKGIKVRFRIVGIPDEDTVTGSQGDIFSHYGISKDGLADTAIRTLNQKFV
jgi:transketolase